MPSLVPNISKGRAAELYNRVKTGDPAASRLYVIPVEQGAATDAALTDADTFADMITAGLTERTANGWSRIVLAAVDLAALTPDDVNNRMPLDVGDLSWTPTVPADTVTDLVFAYAAVAAPTNAQLQPLTVNELPIPIVPAGVVEVVQFSDFYRAS